MTHVLLWRKQEARALAVCASGNAVSRLDYHVVVGEDVAALLAGEDHPLHGAYQPRIDLAHELLVSVHCLPSNPCQPHQTYPVARLWM